MVDQAQANPKPHAIDYIALALMGIGAAAECVDMLPSKYAGVIMFLGFVARLYTKWAGSQQDKDALQDGISAGQELKQDLDVMKAKPAEPIK